MADIQLSSELLDDIQQAVLKQDPDADAGVVMQYLVAVTGYILANQRSMPPADREAFLDELCGFARHVHDDVSKPAAQPAAPPAGQAFGYWEPPKI